MLEGLYATRLGAENVDVVDIGYRDNVELAAPLLAAAGLPVTWFNTAGRLSGQRFWWDRLTHALLGPHSPTRRSRRRSAGARRRP
jgi:hypothetical protein